MQHATQIAPTGGADAGRDEWSVAAAERGVGGARAVVDAFYRALNATDFALLRAVWLDDPLVHLLPAKGGIIRGRPAILAWYRGILARSRRLVLDFDELVGIATGDHVEITGRERGRYLLAGDVVPLHIRASHGCVYSPSEQGWRLVFQHASIEEPGQLARYQRAAVTTTALVPTGRRPGRDVLW
jgi:ketosteroid isomerase-like protein